MKRFNVTGTCIPDKHYMVDLSDKLDQILPLIEEGDYFTINRARQYGKTTVFAALYRALHEKYLIIRLSFEEAGEDAYQSDRSFVNYFIQSISDFMEWTDVPEELISDWNTGKNSEEKTPFAYLSHKITRLCKKSEKELLLMIDEVDKSSNNQIFLNFLGMLRNKYLRAKEGFDFTFKSVLLAGVYDIKNLKLKLRPDAEQKYNSPWNIAADFKVDMSFSPEEIATMLRAYEEEQHTGMDLAGISQELYFYTGGYPFLVSYLCKWIDEEGGKNWTTEQVREAEKELLHTPCTLFDDLIKNYENHPELQKMLDRMLLSGKEYPYVMTDSVIQLGSMLGIFKRKKDSVAISNIIFETLLYNHVLMRKDRTEQLNLPERSQFIQNGKLNIPHILKKFQELMRAEYRQEDEKFVEQQGRLLFLCFLKPIINGKGFYYVEPETRNSTRMDIVVAYGEEEHIIELKIWHGAQYRAEGIRQLEEYMENRKSEVGYLLSFSFLKKKADTCRWISEKETEKHIFEVVV